MKIFNTSVVEVSNYLMLDQCLADRASQLTQSGYRILTTGNMGIRWDKEGNKFVGFVLYANMSKFNSAMS